MQIIVSVISISYAVTHLIYDVPSVNRSSVTLHLFPIPMEPKASLLMSVGGELQSDMKED